jgi:hypothetical protein
LVGVRAVCAEPTLQDRQRIEVDDPVARDPDYDVVPPGVVADDDKIGTP